MNEKPVNLKKLFELHPNRKIPDNLFNTRNVIDELTSEAYKEIRQVQHDLIVNYLISKGHSRDEINHLCSDKSAVRIGQLLEKYHIRYIHNVCRPGYMAIKAQDELLYEQDFTTVKSEEGKVNFAYIVNKKYLLKLRSKK